MNYYQHLKSTTSQSPLLRNLILLAAIMLATDIATRSASAISPSFNKLQGETTNESCKCPMGENNTWINDAFEDPAKCAGYYLCWEGADYPFTCPNGMVFNTTYKGCESEKVTYCGTRPRPDGTTDPPTTVAPTTTIIPDPTPGAGYKCTPGGFIADPNHCDCFWQCDYMNQPIYFHCPSGLYFNSGSEQCDYPHNVTCTNNYH